MKFLRLHRHPNNLLFKIKLLKPFPTFNDKLNLCFPFPSELSFTLILLLFDNTYVTTEPNNTVKCLYIIFECSHYKHILYNKKDR